ncbi:MAG: large subunit ribosomal protein [Solirubrobacteraceae bacterium]|jgi:ribosomal protein L22|nr:large subunit ribosomal protein [Solirubrobacteraceae bacterium]
MTEEEKKDAVDETAETPAEKPKRRTRAKAKPAAEKAADAKADAVTEDAPAKDAPAKKPARRSRAKKPVAAEAPEAETEEAPEAEAEEKPAAKATAKAKAEKPAKAKAEKPAKPAPARKRGASETVTSPPVVRAHAKYVRSSARKARLVCDHIRGKDVDEARAILRFAPRAVARDWSKLLESAVANAEHNHELVGDDLRIKEAFADEGPTLKRFQPRAMGRATPIRKRTSHLTITLTPKETA